MPETASRFADLPHARACRRVDFDLVEVRSTAGGARFVVVSGIKPWADLRVTLEPWTYDERPEFWVIEVVGRLSGLGMAAMVDYSIALPLDAIAGSAGIEVVGASKSERRLVPVIEERRGAGIE